MDSPVKYPYNRSFGLCAWYQSILVLLQAMCLVGERKGGDDDTRVPPRGPDDGDEAPEMVVHDRNEACGTCVTDMINCYA